ncbi:Response regulator PleD [Thalassocella blandensis]|nr:Response regulator PleD [Thalassocella blandensis]
MLKSLFATNPNAGFSAGIAGVLLLVTSLALLSQTLTTSREIPFTAAEITVVDDRSEGGQSSATLQQKEDGLHLTCRIKKSTVSWPYCSVSFNFFNGKHGIDLSDYQQFQLWIRYATPRPQGIRFQARNFNPDYASHDDDLSLKYNTVELYSKHSPYPLEVPLQGFQVPSWWLVLRNLSHQYSVPEFNDIHSIDVVTGYVMPEGDYEIIIEKIALQGKWISSNQLYLALLLVWGGLGFIFWLSNWPALQRFKSSQNPPSRERQERALQALIETQNGKLHPRLRLKSDSLTFTSSELSQYLLDRADEQNSLSLMIIEPDPLQTDNQNPDAPLANVSALLVNNIRQTDMLARWGEHAFILLCPNTELANASQLAEKLRVKVESERNIQFPGLSISIGVAQLQKATPELILADAENALKVAKTSGNCAISATASTASISTK